MNFYITSNNFTDRTDKHVYVEGDIYPHNIHKTVSAERANELEVAGYIAPINQTEESQIDNTSEVFPKHLGGGHYELSNGEKVKGKEAAEEAENALKDGE